LLATLAISASLQTKLAFMPMNIALADLFHLQLPAMIQKGAAIRSRADRGLQRVDGFKCVPVIPMTESYLLILFNDLACEFVLFASLRAAAF
jgi:hypothetical protein